MSERGRAGGYRLGRAADQISVAEIMRAVDEGVRMTRCAGEDAAPCVPGDRCITHGLWDALGEQIAWFLDNVTVHDVVNGTAPAKIGRQVGADIYALPEMGSDPSLLALLLKRDVRPEAIDAPLGTIPSGIGEQ
jgi:DNA-binding IscR family transcriptional regulator